MAAATQKKHKNRGRRSTRVRAHGARSVWAHVEAISRPLRRLRDVHPNERPLLVNGIPCAHTRFDFTGVRFLRNDGGRRDRQFSVQTSTRAASSGDAAARTVTAMHLRRDCTPALPRGDESSHSHYVLMDGDEPVLEIKVLSEVSGHFARVRKRLLRPVDGAATHWDEALRRMAQGRCPLPAGAAWRSVPFVWRTRCLQRDAPHHGRFVQTLAAEKKLDVPQDETAFLQHLRAAPRDAECVCFSNLSKDTRLIVPMPRAGRRYTSLRDFLRHAPSTQQQALWRMVETEARAAMRKHGCVWVSTHGLGVPFLHVRICIKPKYYRLSQLKECA